MENKMKGIVKIVSIGLILILLQSCVSAIGLGVAPSNLEMHDALRGEEYERIIRLSNYGEDKGRFSLNATGQCSKWIYFYNMEDQSAPITNVTIPGNGNVKILVKFKIPEDAATGNYTGTIYAQGIPTGEVSGEVGQVVAVMIPASVMIEVTGMQTLTGKVESITTIDTEINYPLRIKVRFQNTGNVIATPIIDVKISKEGVLTDSFTFAEARVKVGSKETIIVEWDTTGKESGDYIANTTISLGDEVLATKELQFKLLPVGTLSRQGNLTDISYEGEPLVGRVTTILGTFRNSGEIDTKAKFIGEVYVDGELVDTISSEELLVPVRETETLTTYLKIEKDGSYAIKGHAVYEGKTTDTKELSFVVGTESGVEPEPTPKPTTSIPGFGAIEAIIALTIATMAILLTVVFVRKQK